MSWSFEKNQFPKHIQFLDNNTPVTVTHTKYTTSGLQWMDKDCAVHNILDRLHVKKVSDVPYRIPAL